MEKVIFIRFIFLRGVPRGVRIYIVTNIDSTGATYVLGVGTSLQKWVIKLVEREEKNLTSNRIKYFLMCALSSSHHHIAIILSLHS